ncbi:hypothetical protein IWW50_000096 [Coemansia erecta]|nr:hypothetical protein IWW50_000096 [Coemansia erecta]
MEAQKMISPLQGAFMSNLVRAQRPKNVLELGCYIGYSALWLAHGLHSGVRNSSNGDARLWTCERDRDVAQMAKANIEMAGYKKSVTVLAQPAESVLLEWDSKDKLDLVFIDANKSAYKKYYDLVLERDLLSARGQIVVDNVLFHGKVHTENHAGVKPPLKKSRIAAKIHDFNQHVANDPRTFQIILPIFDGLMIVSRVD